MQHQQSPNQQSPISTEQQFYRTASALSRKLYSVEQRLDSMLDTLALPDNGRQMVQVGVNLNTALNEVRQVANSLYQTKKSLEMANPSLAQEAKAYGEKMKAERQKAQEHAPTHQF
jgi:hypothetical protein